MASRFFASYNIANKKENIRPFEVQTNSRKNGATEDYTLKNLLYHIVRHNFVEIFTLPESTPLSWLFR